MKPTVGNIFVKKSDTKQTIEKFDIVDNSEAQYEVTKVGSEVTRCNVGDFILFTDYKSYKFNGEDIYVVREDDIVAVKTNTEIKK